MKLIEVDKARYKKHLNIVIVGFISSLLVLSLLFGSVLIALFSDLNHVSDVGNVVDFVCWGWTAADLVGFNPTINGFSITLGPEWVGNGVASTCGVAGGPALSIQRTGSNDNNTLADFVCAATTVDVVNPGMTCGWSPVSCRFPVTVTVDPIPTVVVPPDEFVAFIVFRDTFVRY